jgi:hypothetical protein
LQRPASASVVKKGSKSFFILRDRATATPDPTVNENSLVLVFKRDLLAELLFLP